MQKVFASWVQSAHPPRRDPPISPAPNDRRMNTRLSKLADDSTDAEKAGGVEWRSPRGPATEGGTGPRRGLLVVRAVSTEEGVVEFTLDAVKCPTEIIAPPPAFAMSWMSILDGLMLKALQRSQANSICV